MKIQCSCGIKYVFDITPEMALQPIQFVCQACGLDSSAVVNEMIRREFGQPDVANITTPPVAAPVVEAAPAPVAAPAESVVPEAPAPVRAGPARIQLSRSATATASAADTSDSASAGTANQICLRHARQPFTHQCLVCGKGMCPSCMELFGYVCSPHCKAKAAAQRMKIPIYAGQKSVKEAHLWRKVGKVSVAIAATLAIFIGVWIWYAWFGSTPKPVLSVRFPEPSISGSSRLIDDRQFVFLHGSTLARYDIKSKEKIWSNELIPASLVDTELVKYKAEREWWRSMTEDEVRDRVRQNLESDLQLYVHSSNVWIATDKKLTRFNWDTGNSEKEVSITNRYGLFTPRNGELVSIERNNVDQRVITRISLVDGEIKTEFIGEPRTTTVAARSPANAAQNVASTRGTTRGGGTNTAGLPTRPVARADRQPLDPARVARDAQNLTYAERVALPATLSNVRHQEQILDALDEDEDYPVGTGPGAARRAPRIPFAFIASPYGHLEYGVRLIEENYVTRTAMKDPPKKSVLNENVSITQGLELANEIVNEMQRSRGGDTVTEDFSRYQVTVRHPERKVSDWTGEVVGPPVVFPLKTVTIVTAGTNLIVLDKSNQKLWDASLTHRVARYPAGLDEAEATSGLGPCAERDKSLYLFDEAIITCFDLATGKVKWRLPSIGVERLFFDHKGMLYVNTTTASPESLKYSQQIDLSSDTTSLVIKLHPETGKTLWAVRGCEIHYLSGKFIYTLKMNQGEESDNGFTAGLTTPSHVTIHRINPKNGRVMWRHFEQRCPLDVQFKENTIELVFKKEVEVLKYLTF